MLMDTFIELGKHMLNMNTMLNNQNKKCAHTLKYIKLLILYDKIKKFH